jgi:uncharacterized protein (DUF433 family)
VALKKVLIDTNVYSSAMKGDADIVGALRRIDRIGFSTISVGELLSGFKGGNREIKNREAVVQGTRIPVSVILDQIASGDSWDDIIKGYPELEKEDIQAALLYASASVDHTEVKETHA